MKVLVLGKGKLGGEIVKQTGWDYLSRAEHEITIDNFDEWKSRMDEYDVVVNCIANTDTYSDDKEKHWKANYELVTYLAEYCDDNGKKLVHISTDYLYQNSVSEAKESDECEFEHTWYMFTKLMADEYLKEHAKNYLICRLSHKPYPFPYDSAWVDVVTNADYIPVISELVIKLIEGDAEGLYNVGTEKKTIYELALRTNKNVKEIFSPPHIPKDISMNISKMENFLLNLHHDAQI
jgi:nucleoside-diphosphate-sugar epimerase